METMNVERVLRPSAIPLLLAVFLAALAPCGGAAQDEPARPPGEESAFSVRWYGEPWVRIETVLDPANVSGRMRRNYDRRRQLWVIRFDGFQVGASVCIGRFGWSNDLRDDAVETDIVDCGIPDPGQVMGSLHVITEVEPGPGGVSIEGFDFEPVIQGQQNCTGTLELDPEKDVLEGRYTCRRTGTGNVIEVIERVDLELRPVPTGGSPRPG
jgi:hypothetical protein